ncbi:MAG: hypothetical protein VW644_08920 [Alphaproteobacteria bacterium]
MRSLHLTIGAGALVALTALASPAPAQMVSPFGKGQVATDPADLEQIRGAVGKVLEEFEVGATASLTSSVTNRAGQAYVTQIFEREGLRCAQVTHEFTAGGGNVYTLPLC